MIGETGELEFISPPYKKRISNKKINSTNATSGSSSISKRINKNAIAFSSYKKETCPTVNINYNIKFNKLQ